MNGQKHQNAGVTNILGRNENLQKNMLLPNVQFLNLCELTETVFSAHCTLYTLSTVKKTVWSPKNTLCIKNFLSRVILFCHCFTVVLCSFFCLFSVVLMLLLFCFCFGFTGIRGVKPNKREGSNWTKTKGYTFLAKYRNVQKKTVSTQW